MSRLLPEGSEQQPLPPQQPSGLRSFRAECCVLLKMGIPLALANLLDRSSLWVTSAFIGQHGGAAELGPASLASTVNNVLGTSVNIGLSLAVQTLASQAAGAGDAAALRRSLQRAYPISLLFSLPVMLLLLCLGPLLRLLGRPPEFANAAAAYGLCILPVATLVGAQRAMTVWLAALQITRPVLLINLVLVPLHALLTCAEPALVTRAAPSPPPPPPPPPLQPAPPEQVRPRRALAARLPRRGRRDVRRQRAACGRDVRVHPRLSALRARVGRLPAARGLLGLGQLCAAPGALRTRRPRALGALAALCAARPAHSAVL